MYQQPLNWLFITQKKFQLKINEHSSYKGEEFVDIFAEKTKNSIRFGNFF